MTTILYNSNYKLTALKIKIKVDKNDNQQTHNIDVEIITLGIVV